MTNFDLARRLWRQSDARRWDVARLAYKLRSRGDMLRMADAIGRDEQTVRNLADAYKLFVTLVLDTWKKGTGCKSVSNLRRKYPYTRWATVCRNWRIYEFDLSEARDWLENFNGGNDALDKEIENKHGAPEWERRAEIVYRQAFKLQTDFGVPNGLQQAAVNYVREFELWEKASR